MPAPIQRDVSEPEPAVGLRAAVTLYPGGCSVIPSAGVRRARSIDRPTIERCQVGYAAGDQPLPTLRWRGQPLWAARSRRLWSTDTACRLQAQIGSTAVGVALPEGVEDVGELAPRPRRTGVVRWRPAPACRRRQTCRPDPSRPADLHVEDTVPVNSSRHLAAPAKPAPHRPPPSRAD